MHSLLQKQQNASSTQSLPQRPFTAQEFEMAMRIPHLTGMQMARLQMMKIALILQMAKCDNSGSEGVHVAASGPALPLHRIL